MKKFTLQTISSDLMDRIEAPPVKVRLFNFADGVTNFSLLEGTKQRQLIGASDVTWVRIYDENDNYYDFISSNIFFTANKEGLMILLAEDTEFITAEYIANMIIDYVNKDETKVLTSEKYINSYYDNISKEIRKAAKKLQTLFSATSQAASSRFDMEDSYEYGRLMLSRKYLIDLVARKIIRENKDSILQIID